MQKHNRDNKRENPQIEGQYDYVVVGGGLSGLCSAVMAARKGVKVALIQDRPVLGGNSSSEVRVWALGATSHMGNNNRWAREGGLIDEIMVENLHRNREGNPILFDTLLLDKVLEEPNLELFLNTVVYEVEKGDDSEITAVLAFNSQNSTSYKFKGRLFCDASGDGIVGYMSGASFRMGAENSEEFHEGFSPSKEYGELLGHTIFLYPKVTDHPVKFVAPDFAMKDMNVIPKLHQINPGQIGCNYWWFEYGGSKDTINDTEKIKMELWRVVYGAWNYIKNSGLYPEAANMTLEWVGTIAGKRESRRFEGLYMMTQHDIIDQVAHPDDIAYGGWAVDLHPADGVFSKSSSCNQYHSKGIYGIPYRCYVSKDIKNLYIVGRLISVSHVAFGSTRVMITSAMGGQAIGEAAAMCIKNGLQPADLLQNGYIKELQRQLSLDGQSIPHLPIDEKSNLICESEATASSTCKLSFMAPNGEWAVLDSSRGMLLPLRAHTCYSLEFKVKAAVDTTLSVDFCCSEKPYDYTPDVTLEHIDREIAKGERTVMLSFTKSVPVDQYAFIMLRRNDNVEVALSGNRISGILSVANKFNVAVNNYGAQKAPVGSGFADFEFFTPERRPKGKNLAFTISPALDCFGVGNLTNGFVRPYLQPNAWVADLNSPTATLSWKWKEPKEIRFIRLYFDTDADHPMETIQWNHPESRSPFCVRNFKLCDASGNVLAEDKDNYQTMRTFKFATPVVTDSLKMSLRKSLGNIPISLFGIEVR